MCFVEWLLSQKNRHDIVGEFAQQVSRREWAKTDDLLVLRVRLAMENASRTSYRALYRAWEEWEASKHLPKINMVAPPRFAAN